MFKRIRGTSREVDPESIIRLLFCSALKKLLNSKNHSGFYCLFGFTFLFLIFFFFIYSSPEQTVYRYQRLLINNRAIFYLFFNVVASSSRRIYQNGGCPPNRIRPVSISYNFYFIFIKIWIYIYMCALTSSFSWRFCYSVIDWRIRSVDSCADDSLTWLEIYSRGIYNCNLHNRSLYNLNR